MNLLRECEAPRRVVHGDMPYPHDFNSSGSLLRFASRALLKVYVIHSSRVNTWLGCGVKPRES
jgi:hypothetical protein